MTKYRVIILSTILMTIWLFSNGLAQQPYRVGTTAANFLEIGFGTAGNAMGDAYVSVTRDLSSLYWNPAGLAFMKQNEAQFVYQPWIADINTFFTGVGLVFPRLGTFSLGIIHVGYGDMEVTTIEMQDGTGEIFSANDLAISFSFGRRLAQWFAFGASAKFVSSKIWHLTANAMAIDLGVIVNTNFFSPTGKREDGLNIGMSISNYGTKMRYGGMDLLQPIDILPNEAGNYRDVPGEFKMEEWELPLIFRIGVSINPIVMGSSHLTLAVDALHPNNNCESVNLGAQYKLTIPTTGDFFLRVGYKALFMDDSEYGFSFGGGLVLRLMHNIGLKIDYAYRGVGIFGKTHNYSVGMLF